MFEELRGKVILVTGASTGIGAAVARAFGGFSAKVGIHYNSERLALRQAESKVVAAAFKRFAEDHLDRISGKSDVAKAFRYGLTRWASFTLFLVDGRAAIDNNTAERAIGPTAIGERTFYSPARTPAGKHSPMP